MGRIRKVIIFKGGVETLDYFLCQMGNEFVNQGCSVFSFDLKDAVYAARKVRKFIRSGETALLTFNFEGLEREEGIYDPARGYLWQEYQIPCFNITADHPYYYDNRFRELIEDDRNYPGLLQNYHHICIDRFHQSYVRTYYPEVREAEFLPLAGTDPYPEVPVPAMSERRPAVLFTGNYSHPSEFEENINWIDEEYAAFYRGIINELIAHPEKTVEEVEAAHCIRELGETKPQDLRLALHKMIFIDLYVRNDYRGRVVAELADHGIPVTVVGKGWEKLECAGKDNLTVLPQTDSLACLKMTREYKLALNVLPWFRDGAHDRIFNSILGGAVCLSDSNSYLQEHLPEGTGVSYYSLQERERLCDMAKELLFDDEKLEVMSKQGIALVKKEHTWAERAIDWLRCANRILSRI